MPDAFVIMQIGNIQLDAVYKEVIAPAINACRLQERRVDKHNKGGLLKSEIINFIKDSEIVVADLTNERPNCYLEVGYTMGYTDALNLNSKLILTCREDHNPDSPNHQGNGPKVHFDLSGYDICYWDPSRLEDFRDELAERISRRRRGLASGIRNQRNLFNEDWFAEHRKKAMEQLRLIGRKGFMEGIVAPVYSSQSWSLDELSKAAAHYRSSENPFDVAQANERRLSAGLVREEVNNEGLWYKFWFCRKDGSLYTLASLPEEMRSAGGALSVQRRILQVADLLLSSYAFYSHLGLSPDSFFDIAVQHSGLHQRTLKRNRYSSVASYGASAEDSIPTPANGIALADLGLKPELALREICDPFFEIFRCPALDVTEYRGFVTGLQADNFAVWQPN